MKRIVLVVEPVSEVAQKYKKGKNHRLFIETCRINEFDGKKVERKMIFNRYSKDILCKTTKYLTQCSQKRNIHQCLINFKSNDHVRRRVVVTGIGTVSPVGCDTNTAWTNILNGYCGIKSLNDPVYNSLPCRIAAKIDENHIKLEENFSKTELRSIAPSTTYALIAGNFDAFLMKNSFLQLINVVLCCSKRSAKNGELGATK